MMTRTDNPHSAEDLAELVAADGRLWPYWSAINAVAVALAESGGNAHALPVVVNPTSPAHLSVDVGLWQINTYWQRRKFTEIAELLDPATNCRLAVDLALTGTAAELWRPEWKWWTAYTAGAHRRHIPAARDAVNAVRARRSEPPL
jgi:hypothetical protein